MWIIPRLLLLAKPTFHVQVSCQARNCQYLIRVRVVTLIIQVQKTGILLTTDLSSTGIIITEVLNPTTLPGILRQTFSAIRTRTFRHFPTVIVRITTDHITEIMMSEHKATVSTSERKIHKTIFVTGHPTILSMDHP